MQQYPPSVAADTPIRRATIADMALEELVAHVTFIQERRMRAHTLYEAAVQARAAIKDKKDIELYSKRLEQLEKVLISATNALDKASKYLTEIQVLRLTVGDLA